MWVGENESAKYCASVLNSLRSRGIKDIFIAYTDNLTEFSDAIEAIFVKTEIQNCIIHKLRNSTKYVSYNDIKALAADMKEVYGAVNEAAAIDPFGIYKVFGMLQCPTPKSNIHVYQKRRGCSVKNFCWRYST